MKAFLFTLSFLAVLATSYAQRIIYADLANGHSKNTYFEVIGKVENKYVIYTNKFKDPCLFIYNEKMNLLGKPRLNFIPNNALTINFISYPDFIWVIYQYKKNNIVYCNAVKVNGEGKSVTNPIVLDSTSLTFFGPSTIYSTIYSEDQSRIMVLKALKANDSSVFVTRLFDPAFNLVDQSEIKTPYLPDKYIFSEFCLSNKGQLKFIAGKRSSNSDHVKDLAAVVMDSDNFYTREIDLEGKYVDEVNVKIDNVNDNFVLNGFYFDNKKGSTDGIFTAIFTGANQQPVVRTFSKINDDLRARLVANKKTGKALNKFVIRDIVLKKDGGIILTAEEYKRSGIDMNNTASLFADNALDAVFRNSTLPFVPVPSYRNSSEGSFNVNNILVLSLDSTGRNQWTNIINKMQQNNRSNYGLSYSMFKTNGKLHFIFNQVNGEKHILIQRILNGDGQIEQEESLQNLNRNYNLMPRGAKQVSASEIVIPYFYRKKISYARLEF